ncbi:MAG: Txe/YoeB family addiction module toxin [Prevotellaceae bacterium]|jgi:toxin YoeB|nr:Txe/YoeB family addiction module toxin [Prevotellaceae bacterium]
MTYKLDFVARAKNDIATLKRSEPLAYKKCLELLAELQEHPETGTGHPKPLGDDRVGQWSRRITQKHRLTYRIRKDEMVISVYAARGHYDDK